MMAKMFYTLDEARSALGKTEDEIKTYAREGRLREFRDGPRLMFKADQVEQLKSELSGGGVDQVDLGTSDSGGLIGLVDTTGASGTSVTLSESDTGQSSRSGMKVKDDTALAADLGLSGTMGGGVPSPGRAAASGTGLSGTAGRASGINVFGSDDNIEAVDPSAQTAISGGVREQVNLEGVGSGSGLLDLTRESDDTSLGAVLDEITPTGRSTGGIPSEGSIEMETPTRTTRVAAPEFVQAPDPMAAAFGALALGGALMLGFGIFVLIAALVGTRPEAVMFFARPNGWLFSTGIGLAVAVVFFIVGMIFGKAAA